MKVYRWYSKISDEAREVSRDLLALSDMYPLYALTDDKKLAKQFRAMRDMSKFFECVSKMTKEEYAEFANKNRDKVLEKIEYEHFKKRHPDGTVEMEPVIIISTRYEYEIMDSAKESTLCPDETGMEYFQHPELFKDEYLDALNKLEYLKCWAVFARADQLENIHPVLDDLGVDDYAAPSFLYDEFEIFFKVFGDTFKPS